MDARKAAIIRNVVLDHTGFKAACEQLLSTGIGRGVPLPMDKRKLKQLCVCAIYSSVGKVAGRELVNAGIRFEELWDDVEAFVDRSGDLVVEPFTYASLFDKWLNDAHVSESNSIYAMTRINTSIMARLASIIWMEKSTSPSRVQNIRRHMPAPSFENANQGRTSSIKLPDRAIAGPSQTKLVRLLTAMEEASKLGRTDLLQLHLDNPARKPISTECRILLNTLKLRSWTGGHPAYLKSTSPITPRWKPVQRATSTCSSGTNQTESTKFSGFLGAIDNASYSGKPERFNGLDWCGNCGIETSLNGDGGEFLRVNGSCM
ncbi:hypothetical protein BJ742DRAFT_774086 [Cladochytrium replicatum]|nr:hypothetical protein BJ742DRAFT_774086 [Cladochytrium replicatum]